MKYYLIGCKGSGMSALAILLKYDGHTVSGSDISDYIYTQDNLKKHNIKVDNLDSDEYLKSDFIILGHSFFNPEWIKKLKGKNYQEYNSFLNSYLAKERLVSVCGSHGKTTLTGLLASSNKNYSFLCGDGSAKRAVNERYFFLESCEYMDHYLAYNPFFIIITNIDYDHVDCFKTEEEYIKSFQLFSRKTKNGLIEYESSRKLKNTDYLTFGLTCKADFYLQNAIIDSDGIKGEVYFKDKRLVGFNLPNLYGEALLLDVLAVIAFNYLQGEDLEKVVENLQDYQMASKRFNITKLANDSVIINDYAHHPAQIEMNYQTIKKTFPDYEYIAFYKPDRASRLEYFLNDFSMVLNKFDQAFLVDSAKKDFSPLLQRITNEKVTYLYKIDVLNEKCISNRKRVYLLMSSKNLNVICEYLCTHNCDLSK